MTTRRYPTIRWGWICLKCMILGVITVSTFAGCASSGPRFSDRSAPRGVIGQHEDRTVREAARTELGDEAADALPPVPHTPPEPVDPGAESLVRTLLNYMEGGLVGEDGPTVVGLARLRNQSNASAAEFTGFRQRLAEILTRPGQGAGLRFDSGSGPVHYRLGGTAYLVTAHGFDQWELYLRLTPADAAWTLWQSSGPIRVLRHPRPGQPQFMTVLPDEGETAAPVR